MVTIVSSFFSVTRVRGARQVLPMSLHGRLSLEFLSLSVKGPFLSFRLVEPVSLLGPVPVRSTVPYRPCPTPEVAHLPHRSLSISFLLGHFQKVVPYCASRGTRLTCRDHHRTSSTRPRPYPNCPLTTAPASPLVTSIPHSTRTLH